MNDAHIDTADDELLVRLIDANISGHGVYSALVRDATAAITRLRAERDEEVKRAEEADTAKAMAERRITYWYNQYYQTKSALATERAAGERMREALEALEGVKHWASSRCPCENDEPNPCPLCGARAESDACKAIQGALPETLLNAINKALAPPSPSRTKQEGGV